MSEEAHWTADHLKVLHDEKIDGVERFAAAEIRRLEEAIAAGERAVQLLGTANSVAQDKFEATVRDGFVKQNEFRGSLDDLGKTMATRRELEEAKATISSRLDENAKQLGELRSRLDLGPVGLAQLQASANQQAGREQGQQISEGRIYAALGAFATILGILNVAVVLLTR